MYDVADPGLRSIRGDNSGRTCRLCFEKGHTGFSYTRVTMSSRPMFTLSETPTKPNSGLIRSGCMKAAGSTGVKSLEFRHSSKKTLAFC